MARRKHYKNEAIIKILLVLGGLIALLTQLFSLLNLTYIPTPYYYRWSAGYWVIILIIGMFISILTIFCGMRKESKGGGEILPFNWATFLILAILLWVFGGGLIAVLLVAIAFLIALIEEL